MARIEKPQIIPGDLSSLYYATLRHASVNGAVSKRYPFRVPPLQTYFGNPSMAQLYVRRQFKKCVRCFNWQVDIDPTPPPYQGPRGRDYWYSLAGPSGLWYYDFFMQQSLDAYFAASPPNWCRKNVAEEGYVWDTYPDGNFYPYFSSNRMFIRQHYNNVCHTYIKAPLTGMQGLFMYCSTYESLGPPAWGYLDIAAYEVGTAWDMTTLTWNNAPALDNQIAVCRVYDADRYHWFDFGRSVQGVGLAVVGGDVGGRYRCYRDTTGLKPYFIA